MDISKILAYIQNKMEEISIEDERQSAPHGPLGYGGPGWETMHKLEMYSSLLSLFEQIEKKEISVKEGVLVDFFDWFLNRTVEWDYEENRYVAIKNEIKDKKINRFSIMEIE